ncbi:MAG: hypothetical protein AAFR13_02985 [Pseudomonadota bacterium]
MKTVIKSQKLGVRLRSNTTLATLVAASVMAGAVSPAYANLDNTASVNGDLPGGTDLYTPGNEPTDTATVPLDNDATFTIAKTSPFDGTGAEAGETIDYTVTIANTGDKTLVVDTLTDAGPQFGASGSTTAPQGTWNFGTATLAGDLDTNSQIDVGETWVYTISYTLTQDDIDNAVAGGTGATNAANTLVAIIDDLGGNPITPTTSDLTEEDIITVAGDLDLSKQAFDAAFPAGALIAANQTVGDIVHYRFTVTNNTNVTVSGASITEEAFDGTPAALGAPVLVGGTTGTATGGTTADLAPGETAVFEVAYTITQADIDNN